MIKRGLRAKDKIYDDAILCPNCGSLLTFVDGIRKCTNCDYQLIVNEIDYTHRSSNLCMICGGALNQNELQICEQCKNKIKKNLEALK